MTTIGKVSRKDDFGIYLCTRDPEPFKLFNSAVVLASSSENAARTVPWATSVKRIDGRRIPIVINKDVLKMLRKHAKEQERKDANK